MSIGGTRTVERDTRFLIFFNGVANFMLGISYLLWSNPAAENVLTKWGMPPNWWAVLWIIAGIMGVIGVWSNIVGRASFLMCGFVMGVFSLASLYAVVADGMLAAIPTTVFLVYLWGLLSAISVVVRQRDNIVEAVADVTQEAITKLENQGHKHDA